MNMLVLLLICLLLLVGCSGNSLPPDVEPLSDLSPVQTTLSITKTAPIFPRPTGTVEKLHGKMEVGVIGLPTTLHVGEVVTLTVVVTNTGQLRLDKMSCSVDIYQENGVRQALSASRIFEEVYSSATYSVYREAGKDFNVVLRVGKSNRGIITLRAVGSGQEEVGVGCGALEQELQGGEHWTSQSYPPVMIQVSPVTP